MPAAFEITQDRTFYGFAQEAQRPSGPVILGQRLEVVYGQLRITAIGGGYLERENTWRT
jgi:hypothetical protein